MSHRINRLLVGTIHFGSVEHVTNLTLHEDTESYSTRGFLVNHLHISHMFLELTK